MSDDWLTVAAADLGVDPQVLDTEAVLDLARDVAHNVERAFGQASGVPAPVSVPKEKRRGVTAASSNDR